MTIAARLAGSYKLLALLVLVCWWPTLATADSGDLRATRISYTDGTVPATVTWNPPFADTNYTAVCGSETTGDFLLPVILSRSAGSMVVVPSDAGNGGKLDCIAIPDSDTTDLRHGRESYENGLNPVVVPWTTVFSDTNYTAVCTAETANPQNVEYTEVISEVSTASVSLTNGGIVAGTIHCIAVPDSDLSDVRRARVTVTGTPQTVLVPWNQPFLDSNYAGVCTDEIPGATGSDSAISILPGSKLPQSITVQPELQSGFVQCLAVQTDVASTTTLAVSPSNPTAGQVVTLAASVAGSAGPVTAGTVTFLSGTQSLGTVQVVRIGNAPGTATLETRFAPGTFTLTAHYNGTVDFQPSSSSPQPLTVTGTEPTITTLSAQPDGNNFDFTDSIFGFGFPAPTGTASFTDVTSMTNLGSVGITGQGILGFQPATAFPTGAFPERIAVGDFKGNGILDLVVNNNDDDTVSVLLGNGDGTFQARQPYPVVRGPVGIAVGDFNGDGHLDLAVTGESDTSIGVLLGNGDGTFQAQQTYSYGGLGVEIAVGDLNGDGAPDLVVAGGAGNSSFVVVFLNNGDGTFTAQQPSPTGGGPLALVVGDFNHDGLLDVATANNDDATVSVLLGNGDGTFQTQQPYPIGRSPAGMATADFNGDGSLDLAITNASDNTVSVLLGNPNGTFQTQQVYPVTSFPEGIAATDMNGDGVPDLVVSNGSGTFDVLFGTGQGTFESPQSYPDGSDSLDILSADFNGDGFPDIAVIDDTRSNLTTLLSGTVTAGQLLNVPVNGLNQTIQSTYTPNLSFYAGGLSNTVVVNGSNLLPSSTVVTSSLNPSQLNQLVTFTATVTGINGLSPTGTVAFTDDGATIAGCGAVQLTTQSGGTSTAQCQTSSLTAGSHTIGGTYSGDQNFAGSSGMLTQTVNQPATSTTTLTVSPSTASAGQVVTLTATVLQPSGAPIIAGSVTFLSGTQILGTVQLVQSGGAEGTATLKTRFAPGTFNLTAHFNGTFECQPSSSAPQTLTVTGTEPTITTLTAQPDGNNFDFTDSIFGFGFPAPTGTASFTDVTSMTNLGSVGIVGPGAPGFQPATSSPAGAQPYGVATGDFNGDGVPDLAISNSGDGTVSVLLGNGDGTFQAQQILVAACIPLGITIGDFNSDGHLDIAVADSCAVGNGEINVFLGNGDGTFQPQHTYPAGLAASAIALADFNGDGIVDLAVTNAQDGTVGVLLGNGDGTFQPQHTYPVGSLSTGIVTADFKGDSITDLAVTNANDNTVSVLLGNGDGTFQPQQTYPVGTHPAGIAAADFNRDGVLDLAVSNQLGNTISVLLGNGDGTFQTQHTYATGMGPFGIAVADFNGDGLLDLAVANASQSTVSVLLGNGDGTFRTNQTYPADSFTTGMTVADLNGDGVPDMTATSGVNTVDSLLGGTITTGQLLNVPVIGSNQTIQSTYTPNLPLYATSLSNNVVVSEPGRTPTTTTVTTSLNPSQVNQAVTFTATVTSLVGVPVGTVTFTYNGNPIPECPGPVSLNGNGVATCTTQSLPAGTNNVVGSYSGNSNFAPSSGSCLERVNQSATSTSLSSSLNPSNLNQPVTLTATVMPGSPGGLFPTGTVTFTGNGNPISECPNPVTLNSGGIATCTTQSLPAGSDTIKASYNGDHNFTASNKTLTQTVRSAATSTVLTSSQNPSGVNQAVTFTATVTSGGAPVTHGAVTFQSNGVNIPDCPNPATVVQGVASCTTQSLALGTDTILATFNDSQGIYASSSATLQQIVSSFALLPISPAQVTVIQSFTNTSGPYFAQTINLTAQPLNGFSGTVTLSCSVAPALTGGTCLVNSPSSGSLASGNLNTTLTISAGSSTPVGPYTVTVTAQDNNGSMQLATLALTIVNNASPITMPSGGANRIPVYFGGPPGTIVGNFSCPLVTGTGITGSENLSQIGGVCTFDPGSVTLPGSVVVTISGCTVAGLRTRTQFFAAFWLAMPAMVWLGSAARKRVFRKKILQLVATLLLILVLLMGVGCGGGYGQLTPTGVYSVLVQGTGPDGTVYSAVVPVTVTPLGQ